MSTFHLLSKLQRLAPTLAALLIMPASAYAVDDVDKSAELGQLIFMEHCAGCHGTDAKGDGPNAANIKPPPADLTEISKRAGGSFPAAHVVEIITYGGGIGSHTKGAMPIWGKIFSEKGGGGRGGAYYSRRAVVALKRYLETIQQ